MDGLPVTPVSGLAGETDDFTPAIYSGPAVCDF